MIEVTDEMLALLREYQMGAYGELDDDCDRRMISALIELHEQSKPKPEPVGFRVVVYVKDKIVSTAIFEDIKVAKVMADTFFNVNASAYYGVDNKDTRSEIQTLYTTPPTREPLSAEQIDELWRGSDQFFVQFARIIEQAHGIGVTND